MTAPSGDAEPTTGILEVASDAAVSGDEAPGARWKADSATGADGGADAGPRDEQPRDEEPRGPNVVTRRRVGGRTQRFEARKVHRLVRHIDPWSTAKFALVFFLAMWIMMMVAALIVWTIAERAGTIGNIESFFQDLGFKDVTIDGRFYVRGFGLVGLVLTFAFSAAAIVWAMVFNLISDIIGGIWITVIEEESARPVAGSPDRSDVG